MAGMGSRLRPLTLTTPKPLLKIAGKTILEHLIESIHSLTTEKITDIAFIIGNFPFDVTSLLNQIAAKLNAISHILIQEEPLGTAHAIYQARKLLNSKIIIAYADTIFYSKQKLNTSIDSIIFTKKVADPSQYGIVKKNNDQIIDFIEKPQKFISDEAIIGIYYFKEGSLLLNVINDIIKNNLKDNNEFQLTRALKMLINNKMIFKSLIIDEWLDTGNPNILLETHKSILTKFSNSKINSEVTNTKIVHPVFIGNNVKITDSVIGPYVTIEDNTKIINSNLSNTIIYNNSKIQSSNINNSIIGAHSTISNISNSIYAADYTQIS